MTPNDFAKELENIQVCFEQNHAKAETAALSQILALGKERVFNDNFGTDEVRSFGKYRSKSYRNKRVKAGRQIAKKDLQFTGQLKRDYQLGQSNGVAAIGFSTDRSGNIRDFQEDSTVQINFDIFTPSALEIEEGLKVYEDIMKECLN